MKTTNESNEYSSASNTSAFTWVMLSVLIGGLVLCSCCCSGTLFMFFMGRRLTPNDGLNKSISKQESLQKKEDNQPLSSVPKYQIIHRMVRIDKVRYAEILIPEFHQGIPVEQRKQAARQIAINESLDEVLLYSTLNAHKFSGSDSYAKLHPDAHLGFLGDYKSKQDKFSVGWREAERIQEQKQ
jgi:hypothetical protein